MYCSSTVYLKLTVLYYTVVLQAKCVECNIEGRKRRKRRRRRRRRRRRGGATIWQNIFSPLLP